MTHTKIVFLVLPRVHLLDLAGAVQVFHEAMDYDADISIEYCSFGDEITTSAEFPMGKLKYFDKINLQAGDYLFIPGAEVDYLVSKRMTAQKELLQWVRSAHTNGVNVCSVCTGAFFLGLTGLLNGRKSTTHWKRTAELKRRFPAVHLMEDILFTEDERIFTSAGVTAGVDLALFILSRLTDDNLSYKVARELVVYVRRTGSESQHSIFMKYRNHIHSGIHKVQDYVHENIQKKVSLIQLADKACMSPRNLTRTFKKETGVTVNEYTTLIRKEMLREFVKNPDMSRKQMARECGLKSERQVIRLLKADEKD
jgi:transcriptional regulator GlxA family with amidase domain